VCAGLARFVPEDGPDAGLAALAAAIERESVDEAARRYCAEHGCHRRRSATDWRCLLPARRAVRVLEIGAGFGDDTVALAAGGADVIALVPSAVNGRIVCAHLRAERLEAVAVGVVRNLSRLPIPTASVDAIALEDVAAAGFELGDRALSGVAGEIDRVLAKDGVVIVGSRHPVRMLPALGRHLPPGGRESLNRAVKRAVAPVCRPPSRARLLECLRRRGFAEPRRLAPIPHEQAIEALVPIERPGPLQYCLRGVLRRNSLAMRALVAAAGVAADAGVLPALLPYAYLVLARR
jgi:SAM-dependent methyltransferase